MNTLVENSRCDVIYEIGYLKANICLKYLRPDKVWENVTVKTGEDSAQTESNGNKLILEHLYSLLYEKNIYKKSFKTLQS